MTTTSAALQQDLVLPSARWIRLGLASSAVLLLLGCIYAVAICSSGPDISGHAVGLDDAFISYSYARNWVRGHGLVFNPGEYVEGYSNLLYVLLMAIPFVAHVDVFVFSVVINTLLALGAWLVLVGHLRARLGDQAAVAGGLLFALSPSVWIWVSSGMETPLILLLQVAIWIGVENIEAGRASRRTLPLLCACIGLLVLARADGFVSALLASGYLFVKGQRRAAAAAGATLVCVFVALLCWRGAYYHDFLPNTYYAKVTSTLPRRLRSAVRELGGITAREGLGVYLLAIVFCAIPLARRLFRSPQVTLGELRFGLAFSIAWLGYWLYIGGDNFEDRFLIILIPIGIFFLLGTVLRDSTRSVGRFVVAAAILVQLLPVVRQDQFGKSFAAKYDHRIKLGKFMKDRWPGRVLATGAAGKIPFFSDLQTIDMLGLCERHIGHERATEFIPGHSKHDTEYVLSLKPDLIYLLFSGDALDVDNISAERYRRAGYRVHYVINTGPQSHGADDILDVLDRPDEEVAMLAHIGWRGALLERGLPAPTPQVAVR